MEVEEKDPKPSEIWDNGACFGSTLAQNANFKYSEIFIPDLWVEVNDVYM